MNEFENGIEIDGLDDIEIENTSVEDIDSENINLIFLGIDQSGSMNSFSRDMKHSLNEFKDALTNSKEADEILVLDEGKIAGIGKHGELLKGCEAYQEIYYSQMDREVSAS